MSDLAPEQKEKGKHALPRSISFIAFAATCAALAIVVIVFGIKISSLNKRVAADSDQLAEAKSNATELQTQLDQAKSASADLQIQLTKANGQLADFKSRLDLARDSSAQFQALVDRAKVQTTDLQAQLDKSKAQSADLQTQLAQATAGSAQMLTQLDQDRIQAMDLQSRLNKAESDIAQLQPLLLKSGHIPVTASFEKSDGGRAFTLHINNLYPQPLSVDVAVAGSDVKRSQSSVIGGSGTYEVDRLTAGESVVIASSGYAPMNLTVQ